MSMNLFTQCNNFQKYEVASNEINYETKSHYYIFILLLC